MCAIARKAARAGGSLQAIARPTQQREAGQAAGNPNFPAAFFQDSIVRSMVMPFIFPELSKLK
jgi:hypothetical protein